ncbi:MAG: M20 family metallopeptidase [Sphingobacteriaceae bacterium]
MRTVETIKQAAETIFSEVQQIRRHIHQNPELSFQEHQTSQFIQSVLEKHKIAFTAGVVDTGIVALIKGKNPDKKTILLRADMDALPIEEKSKVPYASANKGVMHACGHDVHTACALGAAIILDQLKNEFEGSIKIIFQPGEEVLPGGASLMLKEGILENPKVQTAMAQHVFPSMEAGKVGFRPGMYMASTDELYITVNGKGGHAAMPQDYVNPLIIASEILLAIHNQFMKPGALKGTNGESIPTVVAFGNIEGKGATNVIPEKVEIAGTFRTMNEAWRNEVHDLLSELVRKVSTPYGIESKIVIEKGYPFLVNDEELTKNCMSWAKEFLGDENVEELPLRMTAEDFAFISQQVPSCFYRLGTGNKALGITSGVHTPTFDIDEKALQVGAGLMAYLAVKQLL